MRLVSPRDVYQKYDADFNTCVIRYGDMKKQLAEDMVKFIAPIREKAQSIRNDEAYLKKVVAQGAEKARESARQTIEQARQLVGLTYF